MVQQRTRVLLANPSAFLRADKTHTITAHRGNHVVVQLCCTPAASSLQSGVVSEDR